MPKPKTKTKAKTRTYRGARFVQTLYEYDGPKLILLKTPGTTFILAVAIVNDAYDQPFYGCEVTLEQIQGLLDEEYGVRFLFLRPKYKMRFLLDLADLDEADDIRLIPAPLSPETIEYLPGRTFFASDFTEECALWGAPVDRTEKRVWVAGNWEISDFNDLYGGFSDLYSFTDGLAKFENDNVPLETKRTIMEAFDKQWRGGGSYGGFYRSMRGAQAPGERLGLGGFEYHSPGFVDFEGRESLLDAATEMLLAFGEAQPKIAEAYKKLYNYLQANKLLSLPADRFDRQGPLAKSVARRGSEFSDLLPGVNWETILSLSGNDSLVATKVLLSLFRRLNKLNEFQLQGRVTIRASDEVEEAS